MPYWHVPCQNVVTVRISPTSLPTVQRPNVLPYASCKPYVSCTYRELVSVALANARSSRSCRTSWRSRAFSMPCWFVILELRRHAPQTSLCYSAVAAGLGLIATAACWMYFLSVGSSFDYFDYVACRTTNLGPEVQPVTVPGPTAPTLRSSDTVKNRRSWFDSTSLGIYIRSIEQSMKRHG